MSHADEPVPPWVAFPRIPWGSAGWRMGFGEVHWNKWITWFHATTPDAQARYEASYTEPEDWRGFYRSIRSGEPLPWMVERERRIEAAAVPPAPEEREVRDAYRIQWMLRSYLRTPAVRVRVLNYGLAHHRVYRDPAGDAWCFAEPRGEQQDVYLYRYDGELVGEDNLLVQRPVP